MHHFLGIELPSGLAMICYDKFSVDFLFWRDRRIMPQQDARRRILKYIMIKYADILLIYSILWRFPRIMTRLWLWLCTFRCAFSCKSRLVAPTKDVGERTSWKVACGIKSLDGNWKTDCDEKMRMLKLHVKTSFNILLFFATVLNACGMVFPRVRKTVTIVCGYQLHTN